MVLYLLFAKSCELFIFHFILFCFVFGGEGWGGGGQNNFLIKPEI